MRRYSAEAIGTFGVVFTGCGASLIGGQKIGDPGVALAFGLALAAMLLAAGLAYTLIHLVGFQVTRLAANPARALGPALLAGGLPLAQVWLFVVAPLAGGLLAAGAHRIVHAPSVAVKSVEASASRRSG